MGKRRAVSSANARPRPSERASGAQDSARVSELTTAGAVAWWVLLVMVFVIPLVVGSLRFLGVESVLVFDMYDTPKVWVLRVGAAAVLLAWVVDIIRNGGRIRWSPVFWVFLAFVGWAAVSTVLSIEPGTSFFGKYRRYEGLWSYIIYGALLFVTVQYADRTARIRQLAQAVAFSSIPIAVYGLLQAAGIEPLKFATVSFEANRSFATFGNPDLLAGFLAFGIFTSLGLAIAEERTAMRVLYWLTFLINLTVSVTAFSRSIWVGSLVGFLAIAVVVFRQRPRWTGLDWGLGGAAVAAAAAFAISSLSSPDAVMNFGKRVVSIFDFSSGSAGTRFMIWRAALDAVADRPLFGFGPDTFRMVFRAFQPVEYAAAAGWSSVADNVHNYPLQLAAGVGVVGAALFYVVVAWAAVQSGRVLWERAASTNTVQPPSVRANKVLLGGLWAACSAFIVHLMFGLALPSTAFLLFVFGGALIAPAARSFPVKPVAGVWGSATLVAVSALSIATVVLASTQLYADHKYGLSQYANNLAQRQIQEGMTQQGFESLRTAVLHGSSAVTMSPHNDQYRYTHFSNQAWMSLIAYQVNHPDAQAMVDESVAFGQDMLERNPWEYDFITFVQNYYNQLSDLGERQYLKDARTLGEQNVRERPNGVAIRYLYAETLVRLEEYDLALQQLETVVDQAPRYEEAQRLLDEIRQRTESGEL